MADRRMFNNMSYTNFACRSGGSNLNAGTRTGDTTEPGTAADLTYASGNWVASTRVFTVASGNPQSDGVAVGDYVSVYADGSTVTGYVGRVSARTTTTITIASGIVFGSAPTDGTGNRTLKVGGAWQGPNANDIFPFNVVNGNAFNSSVNPIRVNLKNDATYNITASIAHTTAGATFQGYTSAYGDLGKATIDAGSTAIVIINSTGQRTVLLDLIVSNNGSSGSNAGIINEGANGCITERCVAHDIRGTGIRVTGATAINCEAYACNTSNTSNLGAMHGSTFINCIAHDNTAGANCHGFTGGFSQFFNCISDSNAGAGFKKTSSSHFIMINCDAYNNAVDGFDNVNGNNGPVYIMNCNFIKNTGYGIHGYTPSFPFPIFVYNCGFGAGTQVNSSGSTTGSEVQEVGSVAYANDVTPWVDPANGDFRISLAAAKNAGRGAFTQTASSYAGAVGYPDIGAVLAAATAGGPISIIGGGPVQ